MTWDQIKNNWKEVCQRIKLTWGKLSEDDLAAIAGQRDQFAGLLHRRYGYDKAVAESKVDQFARGLTPCLQALPADGSARRAHNP